MSSEYLTLGMVFEWVVFGSNLGKDFQGMHGLGGGRTQCMGRREGTQVMCKRGSNL